MLNKIMKKCLCMLLCILMLVQYTPLMAHATVDQTGTIVDDASVTLQAADKSTVDESAVASCLNFSLLLT